MESSPIGTLIWFGLVILMLASVWRVFSKAGEPGWACLIPVYNLYILLQIAGKPWWWLFLYFIPFINIIITFVVAVSLAKAFNRSSLFGIFLLGLFAFIGYPILAFGNSTYGQPRPITEPQPLPQALTPNSPN